MEKQSQVWLVSQEQHLSNQMNGEIKKELLFEYKSGERLVLPVGYVIQHPDGKGSSWEVFGDDFEKRTDLVMRPLVGGVEISHLEGELLTIVDASFADKDQCKAMKDLIRKTLWMWNKRNERKIEEIYKSA